MTSKLIVGFVIEAFYRRMLDRPVHAFDLAVGPGMLGGLVRRWSMSALAQVYSKAWAQKGCLRAISSLISATVQLSPRGSVKCSPLSASTVGIL